MIDPPSGLEIEGNPKLKGNGLLLCHGLNNCPSVMKPLWHSLASEFTFSANLTLPGHKTGSTTCTSNVQEWKAAVESSTKWLKEASPGNTLTGIGYSLGAALLLNQQQQKSSFDRLILLAPAVFMNGRYELVIQILSPLRYLGISVPSRNLCEYRASSSTHLESYYATLELSRIVRRNKNPVYGTMVMSSNQDELLNCTKLRNWCLDRSFEYWAVPTPTDMVCNHMILNSNELGQENWDLMIGRIKTFLRDT